MAKYKKRKDGRYASQVFLGYDKLTGKRKVKTLYGRTIKELDEKLTDFKALKNKGIIINDKNYTLEQWLTEWVKTYKVGLTSGTIRVYDTFIKSIDKSIGYVKLKDLREFHVVQYKVFLLDHNISAYEIKQRLSKLRSALSAAITNKYIFENAASNVKIEVKKEDKRRELTKKEREFFLNVNLNSKQKTFVYIMYYTGCRVGEIMALTKADIDLNNGMIYVNKHIDFNTRTLLDGTKNGESRIIPIFKPLKPILSHYVSILGNQFNLFLNSKGELYGNSYNDFWKTIKRHANKFAGGTSNIQAIDFDISPHYFRHNFATLLYDADVDLKTAMKLLGHKDEKTINKIYIHLSEEKESSSMNKLNDFFGSSGTHSNVLGQSHSSQ